MMDLDSTQQQILAHNAQTMERCGVMEHFHVDLVQVEVVEEVVFDAKQSQESV